MDRFELQSNYQPTGDQPQAIDKLVEGLNNGYRCQVLKGVTGSGKTFTMANVIERVQRPTLVIAHNKTLAAQLCNEFREFFPKNRVEFFVSYYDYYQPEAYIPRSDTYIEKELQINDEIDKLRHSATSSLFERDDVIVVSSVSCLYGLGAPVEYYGLSVSIRPNDELPRDELIQKLVAIQYKRAELDFVRSTFRVRGDIVDIFPSSYTDRAIRVEYFGDTIERISEIDLVTNKRLCELKHAFIFPATHYVYGERTIEKAINQILIDRDEAVKNFEKEGKLIEAQRIKERVSYDMEMVKELGYCNGIENYSRYFDGRVPGQMPYTLFDFFKKNFLIFVDESHITLPQIRGMYNGDRARKTNLVNYGFRLPSAYDNRPLNFDEFDSKINQIICVSATPAPYEMAEQDQVVEQIIRPTGLVDPPVEVRKIDGQIDDLIGEINRVVANEGRVLVTTLTKKMAESLTEYLKEKDIRVRYMHSEIDTLERIEIVNSLRQGEFDVLVGINLLREGLDLPEVQLVAILDADKEGFLRSDTSLIQTIGRAARNSESKVIMYADTVTGSMDRAIKETEYRRKVQMEYNKEHNITPKTIKKSIQNTLEISKKAEIDTKGKTKLDTNDIRRQIEYLKGLMNVASANLDFEKAITLRDEIGKLKALLRDKNER